MIELPTAPWWALVLVIAGCLLPGAQTLCQEAEPNLKKGGQTTASYYDRPPAGPTLGTDGLDTILAELRVPTPAALSMWDQIVDWLEQFFRDRNQSVLPAWLQNFRLSEATAWWIFYLTAALIVVLSLGIVVNELRHASARRRTRVAADSRHEDGTAIGDRPAIDLADVPLLELPARLLAILISRLKVNDPGLRAASLTHRELAATAGSLEIDQRQSLVTLTNVAERIRYASERPASAEIEDAVAAGRQLVARMSQRS